MKLNLLNLILKLFFQDTSILWKVKYDGYKNRLIIKNKRVLIGQGTVLKAQNLVMKIGK